jgi:glycosyltransferase involved in cell wall biosynthesis
MKVCIVSGYYPGIGKGAEQIYNLVEELRRYSEFNITLLGNKVAGAPPTEKSANLTVIRVWKPNSWVSLIKTLYTFCRLKADIIHILHAPLYYGSATFTATFTFFLLLVARVLKKKGIIWMEHVYPLSGLTKSTLQMYQVRGSALIFRLGVLVYTKIVSLIATRILVQTEVDLQTLRNDYGVKNATCLVIGMKGRRIAKEKAKQILGLVNKRILLIFGFISPYKGIEYAIKANATVVQRFPDLVLLIAGCIHPRLAEKGVTAEPLKSLAKEIGIEDYVVFKDHYIPPTEHDVYYSAADIVLLPYLASLGPSAVMMEAFLHRIPVIASNVDFLGVDISNEITGLLVPPGDSNTLSTAIIRLLSDRKLYRVIEKNIDEVASNYSIEEVGRRLRDLYFNP